ncbi:uncharacterized protein LOC127723222 isoform X1 [Mytilus californianus]|uniref:uncharacterized protein LOC127723222 isoform X1 n=1 Tax=Mytilus californianus TaxID=6549 RepID=UPI0022486AEF|nr:uncharacterized protein LOC127723222 isoform X1 [Mytilus californianus]
MIMGDDGSDEHLKIFKCLVDTGADVLRSALERKVLNNNVITFEQYLDNVKHQFYHQCEKNRNKPCCSQSPHVNCNVNGYMDKKIFNKVYNKKTEVDTHQCLDRFEVKAGISTDELDLSDLNFFLWNSNTLSLQEKQSIQTIMTIRSDICHPESTHCYSITELENIWLSLEDDILLFAEPYRYKKMVTLQIVTLKKYKVSEIESKRIINEMHIELEKILRELKLVVHTRNDGTKQLVKKETVGLKNCIKDTYNKTKSFINNNVQRLTENNQGLTTRCIEEINTTVTQESSNTRLHSEDQRRAIDSKLTECEHRVCQTVIRSRGHLEDKIIEQQNEIRKHTVEINADLKEENRKLTVEVMDMKTDIKELKTILIGYVGKQKVDLVMNTEQIEKSTTKSPDNGKVDITVKVNQTHVTEDKENEIIENLPLEIEILTNNDSSPEAAVTETIEITGKKVNSIILELKATPGILHSVETFKAAMLTLVQNIQTAGEIDVDIEDTITVNVRFGGPLTEDQLAVVKCLFAKKWNDDNNTKQLSTEYSSISDEYSSTSDEYLSIEDINEMEFRPELDMYSQTETSEVFEPETTDSLTKTSCQFCDDKDKIIKALEEQNEKHEIVNKTNMLKLQAENRNLRALLRRTRPDDTGMISVIEKIGTKQKELKSDDLSSLESEQTYDSSSKKTLYECRNCCEKNEIIIQLDRRLCEIRRRIIEAKGPFVYRNNVFEDLLELTHENTGMISDEEKGKMKKKEIQSDISSQKSELIYDSDVQKLEAKTQLKSMELQPRKFEGARLDRPQDKSDFRCRISELRREYAGNSYTKTEGQKGLAIILYRDRGYISHLTGMLSRIMRDPDVSHLKGFFEEMGFVVKCFEGRYNANLYDAEMFDGNWYCVFLASLRYVDFNETFLIRLLLGPHIQGKPIIVMTNSTTRSDEIKKIIEEPNTLMVSPFECSIEYNILEDFIKVTRCNRFADIMDILTRMNAQYNRPAITFQSTLRKKFCFL